MALRTWLGGLAMTLAVAGCYIPPEPARVALKTRNDRDAVSWAETEGSNRVEGTALLRTRGGEARTCAALDAAAIPVTVHAKERMLHIYGNVRGGYNPAGFDGNHPVFVNDDASFYESVRSTKCDADGRFAFDRLPDGEWFIEAIVTWEAPGAGYQGGSLMQRVRVQGGTVERVVLTN